MLETILYRKEITVIQQFIKALKRIIKSLGEYHYFSEFKAGFDHEFDFNVGELQDGLYTPNPELLTIISGKVAKKLMTQNEYEYIKRVLEFMPSLPFSKKSMVYDLIHNLIRNKRILRWSKEEIMKGYKMLTGGRGKYTLSMALRDKAIVKIDLIVLINNKFVEVTNIMSLAYTHPDGFVIPINIDEKNLHDVEGLKFEVEKLYYSDKFYSPFKACKRMYSICRAIKDYTYVERIVGIISGDVSSLYQISSEIDAIIILLERLKTPPIKKINDQLSEMKGRIVYILDITNEQIIHISNEIDRIIKIKSKKTKIDALKYFYKNLKHLISIFIINRMGQISFNPPPSFFLPLKSKYSRDIKRRSDDNPTKEYKDFEYNMYAYVLEYNQTQKFGKEVRSLNQIHHTAQERARQEKANRSKQLIIYNPAK